MISARRENWTSALHSGESPPSLGAFTRRQAAVAILTRGKWASLVPPDGIPQPGKHAARCPTVAHVQADLRASLVVQVIPIYASTRCVHRKPRSDQSTQGTQRTARSVASGARVKLDAARARSHAEVERGDARRRAEFDHERQRLPMRRAAYHIQRTVRRTGHWAACGMRGGL